MSSIPPNWLASGIQAQSAQQKTAETRDKERANAAQQITESRFANHIQEIVEGTERDGDVNPDAEGGGSQGRTSGDPTTAPEAADLADASPPHTGLDLQA